MREIQYANNVYHVCNKYIDDIQIDTSKIDMHRMLQVIDYYNNIEIPMRFSFYIDKNKVFAPQLLDLTTTRKVKVIAYCIMPNHYHLLIKALYDDCLPKYINDVENAFSRYFNIKHKRKGPLWQNPYKSVEITSNELLLHVSRYIHLNPTTAALVEKPDQWSFSSYKEYINNDLVLREVLTEISISNTHTYKKFVEDQKDYQKKLNFIRRCCLE